MVDLVLVYMGHVHRKVRCGEGWFTVGTSRGRVPDGKIMGGEGEGGSIQRLVSTSNAEGLSSELYSMM